MKTCFKCEKTRPLSAFYKHKRMADGHLGKCKECTKFDTNKHRWENIERYRSYDRARGNRIPAGYAKKQNKAHPVQYKARTMVGNAIRDGKLFKEPCAECGEEKVHGHHDDYAKPLNVRWLCPVHHKQWHRDNGPGLNG